MDLHQQRTGPAEGVTVTLKAYKKSTGEEVKIGDTIIDFRGDKAILVAITRVNEFELGGRRSGKVAARWIDRNDYREVYDKVFDLIVREASE